jgi:hypothetical protein
MIHHLAITPKNSGELHRFYTEVMGFTPVKIIKRPAMGGKAGWTKRVFHHTGHGSYFVLWDLHLNGLADDSMDPISTDLGLPQWINHFAFEVDCLKVREERKHRWLAAGSRVSEVVHEFITLTYTRDSYGDMFEFTCNMRAPNEQDRIEAGCVLLDDSPSEKPDYPGAIYLPDGRVIAVPSYPSEPAPEPCRRMAGCRRFVPTHPRKSSSTLERLCVLTDPLPLSASAVLRRTEIS